MTGHMTERGKVEMERNKINLEAKDQEDMRLNRRNGTGQVERRQMSQEDSSERRL